MKETLLNLVTMKKGQIGLVVEVMGGKKLTERLHALGVRPGKALTKVSNAFLKGPVTVQLGSSRVAIGHGMATKVTVQVEKDD